jgi:hypothetical protein
MSSDGLSDDFTTCQAAFGGYMGPQYTFQRLSSCAMAEAAELQADGNAVASFIIAEGVAGLLALYGTPVGGTNALGALIKSAQSALAGEISGEVFLTVMLAIFGSEALADALIAAGVSLLAYALWESLKCFYTGQP